MRLLDGRDAEEIKNEFEEKARSEFEDLEDEYEKKSLWNGNENYEQDLGDPELMEQNYYGKTIFFLNVVFCTNRFCLIV